MKPERTAFKHINVYLVTSMQSQVKQDIHLLPIYKTKTKQGSHLYPPVNLGESRRCVTFVGHRKRTEAPLTVYASGGGPEFKGGSYV